MGHGQTIAPQGIVKRMTFRVPFEVQLLHPTLVKPFDRPGWVYEEKVDGWRMVAYKSGEHVRLVSRRGLDHTARFAALAKSLATLPSAELILDGEVAVFDECLAAMNEGMAEISVADTGVGVAPEDQEAIFEEFRQVGTADKKVEGTGLGLVLSRKFIELHGERIWVQSELG